MANLWRQAWALALAGCAAGAVVAAETGVTDREILIGQSVTLQGGKNDYGVAARAGMNLYIDAVNAAGGVHGRRLVVRTLDDENSSKTADANARKLVDDLLTYSGAGRADKPLLPTEGEAILEDALANLNTRIQETGATMTHTTMPKLPRRTARWRMRMARLGSSMDRP